MSNKLVHVTIRLLVFLTIICSNRICFGQKSVIDSLKLTEYHTNSCISRLFVAIIKSNEQNYKSSTFFYSVTFRESSNGLYMTVSPNRWMEASRLDYSGILRLRKISFLLRGDLDKGGVFHRDNNSILTVAIRKDESDTNHVFFNEPSLQGVYQLCKTLPIDLEVYTKNPIKGFQLRDIKK
jgi:hypothetical protein